jgi:hypothetical protein
MVNVIVAKSKLDCEHLLGRFLDESHYDILVEEDTDCYMPAMCDLSTQVDCESDCSSCDKGQDELRIAFKFRKNFFSKEEHDWAYEGLKDAATVSNNRGLAAGTFQDTGNIDGTFSDNSGRIRVKPKEHAILDYFINPIDDLYNEGDEFDKIKNAHYVDNEIRCQVWLPSKLPEGFNFDEWAEATSKLPREAAKAEAEMVAKEFISSTNYAVPCNSGVAGWFDRYPRIPYGRPTSYTNYQFDKFKKCFPFIQSLNKGFKTLLPWRWGNQKAAADKIDEKFLVPGTVFTTLTVNNTFRTAAHYDAGDLNEGLSNLLVLSVNDNYSGGYLVFPEYRIAVSVRPLDLLLVNNHEVMHGNTPIVKNDDLAERVSIICYFRENMLNLGSYDYEECRFNFVESRKNDPDHKDQRFRWNGITPGMWADHESKDGDYSKAKEWYDYLKAQPNGNEWLDKYHPWLKNAYESVSLEEFF